MPLSTATLFNKRLLSIAGLGAIASAALLHGCSHNPPAANAEIDSCVAIDTLITGHSNGFEDIRKNPRPFNTITIWQTDYEVIKDHCEIWGWGKGNINYVCSIVSPEKQVAQARYQDSIKKVSQCLGNGWVATESPRKVGNGVRTLFNHDSSPTAVSVHLIETPALFNSEWTTYASVGNYSKDI